MKYLIPLVLTLLLSQIAFAQNNGNGAKFKFVQETHDFGNLKEGDEAIYEYVFVNAGNEPLIINNCSASCGCTVPTWQRNPVMPGSKGSILVKFDTHNKNGSFKKVVYIESNAVNPDPSKAKYELYITGTVTPIAAAPATPVVPVKH
jgi:Protein of unknown function (DUF1573)